MSEIRQRTDEEWERFRFPKAIDRSDEPQAVLLPPPVPEGAEEEEESGEEGAGSAAPASVSPALEPPEAGLEWEFVAESSSLRSPGLKKQVSLHDLNTASKIVRLLGVIQLRPEMVPASFASALEQACLHRFNMGVEQLVQAYPNDAVIPWVPAPVMGPKP